MVANSAGPVRGKDDVVASSSPDFVGGGAPLIHLAGLTKRFDQFVAVDNLNLDIARGEFISLLGPSGCGKTTTLRMIGGFEDPTEGAIYLEGQDITYDPPYHRNVNTVFQSYALFPHLTVADNIAFGLKRKKVDKKEINARVGQLAEMVGLAELVKRKPRELSGGQQQRVALARALVNQPKVLLLDEPLSALDVKLRKQMQLELKKIQREVGVTFVFVTHDQEEAMTMSDRVAVMSEGRLEQVGSPEMVYNEPATEFVATFLGAANLLRGKVIEAGQESWIVELGGGEKVAAKPSPRGQRTEVTFGVRPEKISLVGTSDERDVVANQVSGTVAQVVFFGVASQYLVVLADGTEVSVYQQNSSRTRTFSSGERVGVVWDPEASFSL